MVEESMTTLSLLSNAELLDEAQRLAASECQATAALAGAVGCFDSRAIPAAVRRAVWGRDEGRCAFVGTHGRCRETAFLEYHHRQPFAAGGKATVENIELRCLRRRSGLREGGPRSQCL